MRMLSSSLRWNRCNRSLDDFQKCLLNTFSRNISRNGWILRFSRNLVDLINIDDSMLSTLNVSVRCLNHFQKNIFNIFSHISCLCQCSCISDRKRNIQNFCQCLCQKRLSTSGRSQHQNITFLKLHSKILFCKNSFVMVIYRNGKHLFGFILTNHILIKECFHFFRSQQIDIVQCSSVVIIQLFFNDL